MDENKDSKKQNDEQLSDYESLLNDFSAKKSSSDNDVGGHDSEDGFVLSELLDGVNAQDDPAPSAGASFDNINLDELGELNFDDITFDDDEAEAAVSDEPAKTTSGKFEIDIDDDNTDYASILTELEQDAPSGSAVTPEDTAKADDADEDEGIELDLSGFMDDDDEQDQSRDDDQDEVTFGSFSGLEESAESSDVIPGDVSEDEEPAERVTIDMSGEDDSDETHEEITGEYDVVPADESADDEAMIAGEEPPEPVLNGDLDYSSLIEESELDEHVAAEAVKDAQTGDDETSEYATVTEETGEADSFSPDVSYTSYIAAEDAENLDSEETTDDLPVIDDEVEKTTGDIEIETDMAADEESGEPVSYADFISDSDDSSVEEPSFDLSGGDEEPEETHADMFEELAQEDFSLDDSDFELGLDDDNTVSATTGEHETVDDSGGIVISGGDLDGEAASEDDFLGLEATTEQSDDSFLGVADVKQEQLPEIMLEGIEMDTVEQTAAVTRAELYIAQGRHDEAAAIYDQIVAENGVSPFVARRIRELGLDISVTAQEAGELAAE